MKGCCWTVIGLALFCPPVRAGYVCQVMVEEGTSLQQTLGITCNVTTQECSCTSAFIQGAVWVFASEDLNKTLKREAQPGEWYITDPSGRCVMNMGNVTQVPPPQPCPPGFFCRGGLTPPRSCYGGDHCPGKTGKKQRRCPRGFFCPFPASPLQKCPDGAQCEGGSQRPDACHAGTFCQDGLRRQCPAGSYCPFGSKSPRKCRPFAICPSGSESQGLHLHAAAFLLACAGLAVAGARYYKWIVETSAWMAFLVCSALAALMWAADLVIAGFLTLTVVVVSANWALLQIGTCPALVPQLLLVVSLAVAIWLVDLVNTPWSMLVAGLVLCTLLGWLMSRQNMAVVLIGRALLVLAFCVLLTVYFFVDPAFTVVATSLLLLTCGGLLASWLYQRSRQHRRMALPFVTRWRWRESVDGFDGPEDAGREPLARGPAVRGQGVAGGSGASSDARGETPSAGVSFCLRGVSFDLPDGQRLLQDVNLAIGPGKRVAVMGPSGSGKSTLLAVLSGRASYGQVSGPLLVGGHPADDLRVLRHVTGFVPQDDVLLGELTVEENVRFQATLRLPDGTSAQQVNSNVTGVTEDLKISQILHQRVGTPERRGVSGGQRKRVSIAMELVAQPLLLFADEPTSGLDSTTSHDVVKCLQEAAAKLGTTVIAVIHQPRYDTLRLFDELVLLGGGGCLVYAGATEAAVEHFRKHLQVQFPQDTNPADVMLDSILPPQSDVFAETWKAASAQGQLPAHKTSAEAFHRQRVPFFRAVLVYMDRSILQMLRAQTHLLVSQGLCIATTFVLCWVIHYERLDEFLMQSAFAALFLMLLQGVSSQRVFGADLLVTWREARVGMPMVAYFVAKDLAALFEVTLSAAVFTAAYGSQSGAQLELHRLFAGSWAFVYTTFGLNYIFSIILSPGAAQMSAVVSSFISFCVAGVYQPQLPEIAAQFHDRGWMVPAVSPVRWLFGFLLTAEATQLTEIARSGSAGALANKGYDLKYLDQCTSSLLGVDESTRTLLQAWKSNRAWVCSTAPLLLLGLIFRFLAGLCLMLYVHAQTSGWARFFGQSNVGLWKLVGHLFTLLVGSFLTVFLFAEIWTFGILKLDISFSSF